MDAFERGALAIDELPADAQAAMPESEDAATSGLRMSPAAWAVLAIVVIAVVIF